MRLAGKVAVVTGSGTGIGQALAARLAQEGAKVVVNYGPDPTGVEETLRLVQQAGSEGVICQADLRRLNEIPQLIQCAVSNFGRLDILVNNAAVPGWSPFLEVTEELYDAVMAVNQKGVFFCAQAAASQMVQQGQGGRIINISSVVGNLSIPFLSPYACAKAAIQHLVKALVVELAPHGITINAVAPGAIVVERNLRDDPRYAERWGAVTPLGRAGWPDDVAGAVAFLCSSDAAWITGQTLFVDGGLAVKAVTPEGYFEFMKKA
ncbi:MAG: glucose 1-dehydrogenase [Deinococcus sp.]|nr:glucose 1-dehydrogenase [Deinococcus sp.]